MSTAGVAPMVKSDLVKLKMPYKKGLRMIVRPLWDQYFRVNYHDDDGRIKHSYFVEVKDDDLVIHEN